MTGHFEASLYREPTVLVLTSDDQSHNKRKCIQKWEPKTNLLWLKKRIKKKPNALCPEIVTTVHMNVHIIVHNCVTQYSIE